MAFVKHYLQLIPKEFYVFLSLFYLVWVAIEFVNDFILKPKQQLTPEPPSIERVGNPTPVIEIVAEPIRDKPKPVSIFFNPSRLQITGTKISYIRAVINWCRKNIPHPTKSLHPLSLEVKYHNHKKHHGVFYSGSRTICVYVNNHGNICELTDTVIHEYHHYMYMRNNSHQNEYNRLTNQKGYRNNPYEIAARECANKYYKACMKDLYDQGFLK